MISYDKNSVTINFILPYYMQCLVTKPPEKMSILKIPLWLNHGLRLPIDEVTQGWHGLGGGGHICAGIVLAVIT